MLRNFSMSALQIGMSAACLTLMLTVHSLAKETDPGGKDADTDAEIVFEPTSEGKAAADSRGSNEPIDFDAKRPSILGMTVVEDDHGGTLVVDVGASSPAWDAGIRKDDVILSLHGVKAKSFQEWAEGVRKVVADAKAGQTIPVQVLRDGAPLDLQVRISEQKGIKPPRPVKKQRPIIVPNQTGPNGEQLIQPGGVPYPVGGGGYGGFGVVGDAFVDDGAAGDQVPTHAVAQLMAVNNRAGTAPAPSALPANNGANPAGAVQAPSGTAPGTIPPRETNATGGNVPGTFPTNATSPTGNGTGVSGQVGMAEFADDAGGMLAMVTLGGLPAGSYRVGIGEFSGGVGGAGAVTPNTPMTSQDNERLRRLDNRNRQQHDPRVIPPGRQRQPVPPPDQNPRKLETSNPGPQAAPGAASGGAAIVPRSRFYVLAQVTPASGDQPPANTVTGQKAGTGGVPPTAANPLGPNPVAQPGDPNQARQLPPPHGRAAQMNQPGARQQPNSSTGTGGQFGIELGVVTVRPTGGGQLQQRIEGIRVSNVVGQSVLVVPVEMPITGGARAANQNQRGSGSIGVVASGIIQLASSGQPTNAGQVTNPTARTPGTAQGSAVTQPAPLGASATQQLPPQTPAAADRNQP